MLSRGTRRVFAELLKVNNVRCLSWTPNREVKQEIARPTNTFLYEDLDIELLPPQLRGEKPPASELQFGKHFSDHMFECSWRQESGWSQPKICPIHPLQMHPAAKVLHYAQELFEGMKAYRGPKGEVRLFRPELNIKRLLNSAERLGLPVFDSQEFLRCIFRLVDIEREWVPSSPMSSLYIRPAFCGVEPTLGVNRSLEALLYIILGPVGAYYSTGVKPVSLLADPQYVRAWPGGTGDKKLGCNYAPTLAVQKEAEKLGLQQVLWLFGPEQQITEVGAMNVFVFLRSKDGEPELVTPPLSGIILPGITRRSVLDLTRQWNEFKVSERKITMAEVSEALAEGRLMEMFGCGTACIISPIGRILHRENGNECKELKIETMKNEWQLHARIMRTLQDIQYGLVEHPWSIDIDDALDRL